MTTIVQEEGNEAYYNKATDIVKNTYFLRVAARTLELILPSEREKPERKEYYEALIKKIKEGKIFVEYLFSLPETEKAIIEYVKKNGGDGWEEIKKDWMGLADMCATVALRYVEHDDFISGIIGDHHTLIGWTGDGDKRIIGITYITNDMSFYTTLFDEIIATGSNAHLEAIQRIEDELNLRNLLQPPGTTTL